VSVDAVWLSVFADVPADHFRASLDFWQRVTGTTRGEPAGDDSEFTPLVPPEGDRYLWLQLVRHGPAGWHPDLHVSDLDRAKRHAVEAGGRLTRDTGDLAVFATPAGQAFCLVAEPPERTRRRPEPPTWDAGRSLADQLCLDIPAERFEEECEFWTTLTRWPMASTGRSEFRRLQPPGTLPVQFLLQRLGADDADGARAHLDLSADDPDAEVARHLELGATVTGPTKGWTTMRDPGGLTYCVTRRRPGEPPR
jgi:predicted enzyme related to lactoylglutathione lyase